MLGWPLSATLLPVYENRADTHSEACSDIVRISVKGFQYTVCASTLNYRSLKIAKLSKDAFMHILPKMEKIFIVHI